MLFDSKVRNTDGLISALFGNVQFLLHNITNSNVCAAQKETEFDTAVLDSCSIVHTGECYCNGAERVACVAVWNVLVGSRLRVTVRGTVSRLEKSHVIYIHQLSDF
jgi:hypothetical protein